MLIKRVSDNTFQCEVSTPSVSVCLERENVERVRTDLYAAAGVGLDAAGHILVAALSLSVRSKRFLPPHGQYRELRRNIVDCNPPKWDCERGKLTVEWRFITAIIA